MMGADLTVLVAFVLLGLAISRAVLRRFDPALSLGAALPVGGGVLTYGLFLVSWVGIPLSVWTALGVWVVSMAAALVAFRGLERGTTISPRAPQMDRGLQWLLLSVLAVVLLTATVIGVGRGYSSFDAAVGWSLKGYGMFEDRTVLAAADWGSWGSSYPLNMPLQIGLFYGASSDAGTHSKILFPLFLASLLALCYWYWRRNGVDGRIAVAGLLFLATIRLVYYHATIGYANLPFTFYLVAGSLLALEGLFGDESNLRLLGGGLLALACWTRAEGIGYCLFLVAGLLAAWALARREWRVPVRWLVPIVLVFLPWYVFARTGIQESHLGVAMGGVLPSMKAGQFNLFQLYLIPRLFIERALSPTNMGLFIPVSTLLLLIGMVRARPWRQAKQLAMAATTAIVSLMPIGLFYVRSFTRLDEFQDLLIRSFDRAFLPATFMIVLLAVWMAAGSPEEGGGHVAKSGGPRPNPLVERTRWPEEKGRASAGFSVPPSVPKGYGRS